jgi:hypothetical protein
MTGFDVIQSFTTLWEEILSLIVWASAVAGSGLAVLVVGKWWAGVEEHATRKSSKTNAASASSSVQPLATVLNDRPHLFEHLLTRVRHSLSSYPLSVRAQLRTPEQ